MIDETSEFDQLMDGHAIPVVEVFGLLLALDEFEFLFWVIDEGAKFALVAVAHCHTEDVDDFAAYLSGSVAQHVIESVGFAMDIAQEVLGTLREAHDGLKVDDLGRDTVDGREFFAQELKISLVGSDFFNSKWHVEMIIYSTKSRKTFKDECRKVRCKDNAYFSFDQIFDSKST